MVILHEGHHRLLMDEKVNWECYILMKAFLKKQILGDQEIVMAKDIMEELLEKQRAMHMDNEKEISEEESSN